MDNNQWQRRGAPVIVELLSFCVRHLNEIISFLIGDNARVDDQIL